jgi:formylglycine-generating enzyme required for sulfatase activity
MAYVAGGRFAMGDHHGGGREDESQLHEVSLDPFFITRHEITNRQYCDYLNCEIAAGRVEVRKGVVYGRGGREPYLDTAQADADSDISWSGRAFTVAPERGEHPVVEVSWFGAAAYCNWLGMREGYPGCYDTSGWKIDLAKGPYRLPTEAQWEYAARGSLENGRYPWGDRIDGSIANFLDSGDPYEGLPVPTTPAGYYNGRQEPAGPDAANGYGLYDVAGNVWEWCGDWYDHKYYEKSPAKNPAGPESGIRRVMRGGCWVSHPDFCRVSTRGNHLPPLRSHTLGFRVVRSGSESVSNLRP